MSSIEEVLFEIPEIVLGWSSLLEKNLKFV